MIREEYGIKAKPITARNPQANAIVERIHQVIGNIIRTFELEDNYLDEDDPWKGILSATAFAVAICGFLRSVEKTNKNSFLLMTQNYDSGLTVNA